ncbi:hypothetical protein JQ554_17285 [Bradyrhizobium diazoefficiens]|nr:hypothetical protein [Bradyrhizobium diazoefficiens]MBR0966061.1 hypothetical protein [Bradyrhizobium diazoefficiens]MBR0979430.1 hypothetical protein [Bradyrhizobium diazoefficiens]MBR1006411.1 hypothetical protein [Bradyrhizobium diazoefficiens]MBR1015226.1 hypothetical protein [Bradyrhizobium diazoefficiens]MBR1052899.1 hypothetical protein [Bradyrhizobium diazoefficiens]
MRSGSVISVLALALVLVSGGVMACDVAAANAALIAIQRQLTGGEVKRIELLKISDRLLASIPISPEHFASYSSERAALDLSPQDAADLAATVTRLSPAPVAYEPDLRWQFLLRDGAGNTLHTIFFSKRYLQGRGRSGYLDGNICGFSSAALGAPPSSNGLRNDCNGVWVRN